MKLGLDNMIYFFSLVLLVLECITMLFKNKDIRVDCISFFLLTGVIACIYSSLVENYLVSLIGFSVLFLNLLIWKLFFMISYKDQLVKFFKRLIAINIVFAVITGALGMLQYYIDPTLQGFATHEVYGNANLLASGRYIRRVTALMGSPQNYALYLAIMTCITMKLKVNKIVKVIICFFVCAGGLMSGSRAYTIFIATVIFLYLFQKLLNSNDGVKFLKNMFIGISISLVVVIVVNVDYSVDTFGRIFTFFSDWPAFEIFTGNLSQVDCLNFCFGKGMGINERIVVNLLGEYYYKIIGEYTNSYESYILSVFMQMGIFGLIGFLGIYIKSLKKLIERHMWFYISLLIAIFINLLCTPCFNGLTMSFLLWPIILLPCYLKKDYENSYIEGVLLNENTYVL